mmetsp:Transcript_958/g.1679  ORF Transcript_958/g.1679 Transcript_958/m.1679 type:complete len:225 (-) Transcript_958:21-695(-)
MSRRSLLGLLRLMKYLTATGRLSCAAAVPPADVPLRVAKLLGNCKFPRLTTSMSFFASSLRRGKFNSRPLASFRSKHSVSDIGLSASFQSSSTSSVSECTSSSRCPPVSSLPNADSGEGALLSAKSESPPSYWNRKRASSRVSSCTRRAWKRAVTPREIDTAAAGRIHHCEPDVPGPLLPEVVGAIDSPNPTRTPEATPCPKVGTQRIVEVPRMSGLWRVQSSL